MNVPIGQWLPFLMDGAVVTLRITVLAGLLAFSLSALSGMGRLSALTPIRWISGCYIELFRASSLLVLLFWVYFALPIAGLELSKTWSAVLAIGLNIGAYGGEIVRSSILAVPKGQYEASIALNLRPYTRFIRVVLPQAFVRMLPPMGNLSIEMLKSTSLVYFITMADLTYEAMILRNNYYTHTPIIFGLLLLIYYLMSSCVSWSVRLLERKLACWR
ncbi:ectoine/hydroxyectoine ABC transporter permease subunit EhuC [Paenibacillus sp. PAMC21692]|jgi:polar amino acid transport system permease protein|uniref:ectoine/hydroxyectoine ABC transporter permease subunit EhuC n=1 Tax=Paenibacillus sp. PAMC21692 TaxID=2762320 RepID=UPI00164DB00F|nr:ectoine/hydroxyectoine ABC transporter permease subunit EhuC [Paenibacillus sp. PAMC21692]QNK55173.1 ectoine/hydroxyectoine ABC transporter permease subunit EhuC [Paenibacillus sp. PAMC21692]